MQIRVGNLKALIENQVLNREFNDNHRALHEAHGEGPMCKIRFKKGQKYEIKTATRVIPDPNREGLYFGGEATSRSTRGRGTTAETIRPGTELLCYDTAGSDGYFIVPSERGNLRVRINVNKFCSVTRAEEEAKRASKIANRPAKGQISDDELEALLATQPSPRLKQGTSTANISKSKAEKIAEIEAQLAALKGSDDDDDDDIASIFK